MNQNTLPKIIMGLAIILFIFEFLLLDFNYLKDSFRANYLKLLVPILIALSMWMTMKEVKKKKNKPLYR